MTLDPLFSSRCQAAWKTGIRYAKQAVSGSNSLGLAVLYFAAAFLYTKTTDSLSATIWTQLAAALLTAGLVAPASVRTFLRKADLALLAPSPYPMVSYLRSAFLYSLLLQLASMLLLAAIVNPLYVQTARSPQSILLLAVCLLVLKAWSVDLHWRHLRLKRDSLLLLLIRWVLVSLFLYGLWTSSYLYLGGSLLLMAILTIQAAAGSARYHLPWLELIERENRRIDLYYSVLNLFIDVPHKRKKVRGRAWAVYLFDRLTGAKRDAYLFLLVRHVIRTGETFAIYLRLSAVALVILAWAQSPVLMYALCLLSLAAAGKQVTQHIRTIIHPPAIRLLPISSGQRQKAAMRLCLAILGLLAAGLAVVILSKAAPVLHKLALIAICLIWSAILTLYFLRNQTASPTYHSLPKH
ncbi:ABC transporter permease [Brevibacillus ruminantium]|uniref:ABC transporter permease n=1 Tax=Brevibacillus ruminantium TaxID=2950604 RepID=A0ABY4WEG2_9BACL|nr:ABC transporter permease [Brevibacillus ruminantium]USG65550.1 ABC transporter permease [Brevibacillus ruminantium]